MWATGDRFIAGSQSSPKNAQTFNTFSDYLRHQFQLSKNNTSNVDYLTDMANKRSSSASPKSIWSKGKIHVYFLSKSSMINFVLLSFQTQAKQMQSAQ